MDIQNFLSHYVLTGRKTAPTPATSAFLPGAIQKKKKNGGEKGPFDRQGMWPLNAYPNRHSEKGQFLFHVVITQ